MSRPSRGFTVAVARRAAIIVCPAAATLSTETGVPDDWTVSWSWSPAVTATHVKLEYSVNGDPYLLLNDYTVFTNPGGGDFNPFDFGAEGDTLNLRIRVTGLAGCPDILSNVTSDVITP